MMFQNRRALGILELDEGVQAESSSLDPRPGGLLSPTTFDHPIVTELVEGAWPDMVIRGYPSLEGACVAAATRLVERGAAVISSDCGFFIRHQEAVAAAVNVPVVMSSLLLVPTLLRQLAHPHKLAVVTADSRHFGEDLLRLDNPRDRARVVIGGVEGGEFLRNALMRPAIRTEVDQIEKEVTACVTHLRAEHPEIAMLLMECTGFPYVTNALRRHTGLPTYDITNLCRLSLAAVCSD
ncbi:MULTISPECIES: hypothetical protein [Mesorhizobium]|nr:MULTISPECIES: hypothetical protein [Mesorhizobium]MCA0004080.1 hypothetical protein [Mesorhizobium sp. B264B2A]MCA0010383.1 hypothetical protein [Mesorhizobium sp. B264B1B]MCA0016494.1 hypothetical protein [Mesorhizobium sp. B294B1A1]MCA0021796.1 hypothetical protein [Mesorhizobium sp. B264B1A]MCA0028486.1 hypothetical protein [Mesorhizobium sp. B263B1A]MCA0035487.1 hypothetical protein [Mesorhizobium sp. B263B2A]MCA0041801.1 hypothetical protein [Mesorhizobium sp. B292B1B]MCA0059919.1 h